MEQIWRSRPPPRPTRAAGAPPRTVVRLQRTARCASRRSASRALCTAARCSTRPSSTQTTRGQSPARTGAAARAQGPPPHRAAGPRRAGAREAHAGRGVRAPPDSARSTSPAPLPPGQSALPRRARCRAIPHGRQAPLGCRPPRARGRESSVATHPPCSLPPVCPSPTPPPPPPRPFPAPRPPPSRGAVTALLLGDGTDRDAKVQLLGLEQAGFRPEKIIPPRNPDLLRPWKMPHQVDCCS